MSTMQLYRIRNKRTGRFATAGTNKDTKVGKFFTAITLKLHLAQFFTRNYDTKIWEKNRWYPYNSEYEVVVYDVQEMTTLDLELQVDLALGIKNRKI